MKTNHHPGRFGRAATATATAAAILWAAPALAQDLPAGANPHCPVMTEEESDPTLFVDYQGVRVYFCCTKCVAKFEKDPAAYLANLPEEMQKRLPAAPAPKPAPATTDQPAAAPLTPDQQALMALLFATDNERAFLARRAIRMGLVPKPPAPPDVSTPTNNDIDRFIAAAWAKAGLPEAKSPPPLCDDATFVRRVYLDLIGVAPTPAEAERFIDSPETDKRAKLIDELLARDDDYAAHWTPFWEDALGSVDASLQGGVPTRGNYRDWIYNNFKANKPYDLMVAELIDPTLPGHKAATTANANGKNSVIAYIRNETHTDTLQSAAAVGQVFLGTGMKCASCHSHFENPEWPQSRFLSFASLLAPADLEIIRCEQKTGQIAKAGFPFDLPGAPADVPPDLDGRLRRAAQLLTDPTNPRFAKAIVNRLWKRYLGLGLFEPADDFRLDDPPSHPELLDWLAHDFMAHGYDLKHTIRLILTSRTYQHRYDPALADHFDVSKPTEPRYARSPSLRRLTAEQLVDTLRTAGAGKLDPASRLYRDKTSTALSRALGKPASRNEISTARPDDAATVQALELLNGEEFHHFAYASHLLASLTAADPAAAADTLYWALLSRPPTPAERDLAAEYLKSATQRAAAASSPPEESIFIDDDLPAGATPTKSWQWAEAPAPVYSGKRSHTQTSAPNKPSQHYALGAYPGLAVGPADSLFVYVHLDPANPPRQIMVQWNAGEDDGWEHRAFWGDDIIAFGHSGLPSRRRIGPLPPTGQWVRLEIPARDVGLARGRSKIIGMSFDQVGGTVHWDKAGLSRNTADLPAAAALGDLFWALASSPEFQYIR